MAQGTLADLLAALARAVKSSQDSALRASEEVAAAKVRSEEMTRIFEETKAAIEASPAGAEAAIDVTLEGDKSVVMKHGDKSFRFAVDGSITIE